MNEKEINIPVHEFDQMRGYYVVGGEKYDRVTSVIGIIDKGFELKNWFMKHGEKAREIAKQRGDYGQIFHQRVEEYLHGIKYPKILPNMTDDFDEFLNFMDEHVVEMGQTETMIFSEKHKYAGILDFCGYVDNDLVVIDWKTSGGIWDENLLQLCAYVNALHEMTGKKVDYGCVFSVKNGDSQFKKFRFDDLISLMDVFLSAQKIYRFKQQKNVTRLTSGLEKQIKKLTGVNKDESGKKV